MSAYTEEYLKNKLTESLGATHVVSFQWKVAQFGCWELRSWQNKQFLSLWTSQSSVSAFDSIQLSKTMSEPKILVNFVLIAFAIGLRSIVSLYPFSGAGKPPMFGDYEAQRHWQEITVNLPASHWYENTTDNDLLYWGLDYPPLTAYHSFLVGKIAEFIDPNFVRLHESRGIATAAHKNFMRLTVIAADILIYVPAMLIACNIVYEKVFRMNVRRSAGFKLLFSFIALTYPGQILIDNGHFQYNNISLGLAVLAVGMIAIRRRILGAIFFVLALNYKQMELYHALPFFCYLLTNCFADHDSHRRFGLRRGIARLVGLGVAVIVTFVIIWMPWLDSKDKLLQVVLRIFPIDRGVFEDKVSNVWCIVNVFHKIKWVDCSCLMRQL